MQMMHLCESSHHTLVPPSPLLSGVAVAGVLAANQWYSRRQASKENIQLTCFGVGGGESVAMYEHGAERKRVSKMVLLT